MLTHTIRYVFGLLGLMIMSTGLLASPYRVELLSDQLLSPWSMVALPDGAVLITEKAGVLKRLDEQGALSVIAGVPEVYDAGQGGLLDIKLHPEFAVNRVLYVTYVAGDSDENALTLGQAVWPEGATQLSAFQPVFKVTPSKDTPVHYGGRIAILPDKTLLLTSGDGFDYRESAQRKTSLLGKIIRIGMNGEAPADNPFKGDDVQKFIWSIGHRNPQALLYDSVTRRVYSHEHGPAGGDEINHIEPGKNYGWPVITHGKDYSGANITPFKRYPGMEQPLWDWTPSVAPSDMILYRGNQFPELYGKLLVTTLKSRALLSLKLDKDRVSDSQTYLSERQERWRGITQDRVGNILLLTDSGKLFRLKKRDF